MLELSIVSFSSEQPMLHGWLYDVVKAVCYDREYCYRAFTEAFRQVVMVAFDAGGTAEGGCHRVYGLKSDYDALLVWHLPRRLNYSGFHRIDIDCVIVDKLRGCALEQHSAVFELSLGEQVPRDAAGNP